MIPEFPQFKKLELADREEVEKITGVFDPYSDFNFTSLWSWDFAESVELSLLNGNLVVRFCDYLTAEPFLSFIGLNKVAETAKNLLQYSIKTGMGGKMALIPEPVAMALRPNKKFTVSEDIDHFDYIYKLSNLASFSGNKLRGKRNQLNRILREGSIEAKVLDIAHSQTREKVVKIFENWAYAKNHKDIFSHNELKAILRILSVNEPRTVALEFTKGEEPVGFVVAEIVSGKKSILHFSKALISHFSGLNSYIIHACAKKLVEKGCEEINFEQDLGLEGLRKHKNDLQPIYMLKKYSITLC